MFSRYLFGRKEAAKEEDRQVRWENRTKPTDISHSDQKKKKTNFAWGSLSWSWPWLWWCWWWSHSWLGTICFSRPRFTYTTGSKLCSKAAKGTNFLQSSMRVNWSQSGYSLGTSCWQSHSHPARFGGEGGVPGHEPTGGKGGDGARVTC